MSLYCLTKCYKHNVTLAIYSTVENFLLSVLGLVVWWLPQYVDTYIVFPLRDVIAGDVGTNRVWKCNKYHHIAYFKEKRKDTKKHTLKLVLPRWQFEDLD